MSSQGIPLNVLIIDDDPIARMLAKRNLEIAGFSGSIVTAENGEMGYDIITNSSQEFLVVLDYHMPELDGIGLLKKLKSNNYTPPVFMLTSSILSDDKRECLVYECVKDYLVKPIDQLKTKQIIEYSMNFKRIYS
jgi:CheY-like chemotaxis protein